MKDRPEIDYRRPAAAALPVLLAILTAGALGWMNHQAMVILWIAAMLTLAWFLARYHNDLIAERRLSRIEAAERAAAATAPGLIDSIVEGMPDPLLLLDPKRRVTHANRAARDLLGDALTGKDISFYLRHPSAVEAIDATLESGKTCEREFTLLDPVERTCLMRTGILETVEDGAPLRYVLVSIYDLTKIKRAEKMRADFVANASHELRTPLASIIGFIETLSGPAAGNAEARKRFLGIMSQEASRMQRLIADLLSLSRIEMDEHVPPSAAVDLTPILRGIADTQQLQAGSATKLIDLAIPPVLPPVRADRDQLVQVFQNLVDNALKYGRAGEPVDITVRQIDRIPGRKSPGVAVAVFNKGDGIPAEHIPRLTERFYRVDSARSRKLGGTGLGLAIVKHIVTRHRGVLNIESTPGIGTTVTVYLPTAEAVSATS